MAKKRHKKINKFIQNIWTIWTIANILNYLSWLGQSIYKKIYGLYGLKHGLIHGPFNKKTKTQSRAKTEGQDYTDS
jgi:hypothetical protein